MQLVSETTQDGYLVRTYDNGAVERVLISEPLPEPPDEGRVLSILGFRSRFTQAEKIAIYTAAKTEVEIQIWLDDLNAVKDNEVHLDDERTVMGVQALEAAGLIGAGRTAEILA